MSVQSSRPTGVTKTDYTRTPKEAWLIVALLFLFMLINFADKAVIGIAAVPIMQELQLSPRQFGLLGSSFYLVASFYGGTGLLIVVSVALDLVQKINSHLVMRNYPALTED